MIDLIKIFLGASLIVGSSVIAHGATTQGWGLPGMLEEPVNIRQESVRGTRGVGLIYFGSRRRHYGGGIHGGK